MTVVFWILDKWKLSIHWDRRLKWWHFNKRDDAVKITTLWDTLFWFSWDYIWIELIREIYDKWSTNKEHWLNLYTLIWIQSFVSTIKENTLVKEVDICFMFLNNKIQISIMAAGYIEEVLYFDEDNWLLVIWSGTPYVIANYATQLTHKWSINIDEIFRICHRFDTSCSSEYDSLYLN